MALVIDKARIENFRPIERKCGAADCEARHYANDHCKKHYTQVLRHGKLTPDRERGIVRLCKVKDCGRTDTVRFYCRKHARQLRVHKRLTPEREHLMGFPGCTVVGCKEDHRARGLCALHYNMDRWIKIKAARAKKKGKGKKKK